MAETENSEGSALVSVAVVDGDHDDDDAAAVVFGRLNDLPEALLAEVLCRVDTAKSATRCKLVSRGWYSLISSNYFVLRFISCHANNNSGGGGGGGDGFAFITCYYNMEVAPVVHISDEDLESRLDPPSRSLNLKCRRLSLDYFPEENGSMLKPRELSLNYLPEESGRVFVVASFNDLLLCLARKEDHNVYYICNPITMQWIGVSSPMINKITKSEFRTQFALVCKPCSYNVLDGEYSINTGYQFVIVRMDTSMKHDIMVETYFSETGKWCTSYLVDSKYGFPWQVVYWNNKLHWVARGGVAIVAYDPFNKEETRFIDASELELCPQEPLPPELLGVDVELPFPVYAKHVESQLCVSQDRLRCIRFCSYNYNAMENANSSNLSIWELKDCKMGKWSLEHRICMRKMVRGNSWLNKFLHLRVLNVLILGCHSTNKDIVYLLLGRRAVLCNLKTRKLKLFAKLPKFVYCFNNFAFPLSPPCWPTLLPPPDLHNSHL